MKKIKKRFLQVLLALVALYLLLLIPDSTNVAITRATAKPFSWNKDDLWLSLEKDFREAKTQSKQRIDSSVQHLFAVQESLYAGMQSVDLAPDDTSFNAVTGNFFMLAALVAAMPARRDSFIHLYNKIRTDVKLKSRKWDPNSATVRNGVYQLLYGMRAAVEEVLLQTENLQADPAMMVQNEPSAAPFTTIFGIRVHSGDLLVSRGGAEVSALISRGNDYPGNFSHVALIYVDGKTGAWLIEAHIEKGVAISSVEQYIKDKKLRFMVLRPRYDLPQLKEDPLLVERAALLGYAEANKRHIPYDFKMNFKDSAAMFCSEVGSYAYRKNGLGLWQGVSTISSQGVINWLHDFGVENFVTQMPSDLEYDPQLSIVAEWRDPETLYKDHIDNAVMDVLLEDADKGRRLNYSAWQLPVVRVIKAWCIVKNYFGKPALIPEGMSATQALKNQYFVGIYKDLKTRTIELADEFIRQNKYRPPYWQLVKLARKANEMIGAG